MYPRRMWINQPSSLQPLHKMHGMNVLAIPENNDRFNTTYRIYFLEGNLISMQCNKLSLSEGWK